MNTEQIVEISRGQELAPVSSPFGLCSITAQGVVTLIKCIEPFATGIKMKSTDQEVIFD